MANQYSNKEYDMSEVEIIISKYKSGMSFTKIVTELGRQKNNIKKILIKNNVWVDGKNSIKKEFLNSEIENIKNLYLNGSSCEKIGKIFNVSKTPIKDLLKKNNILRVSNSNGVKLTLTEEQKEKIKFLYLNQYKNCYEISLEIGLSESYIDKFLSNSGFRRSKSIAISIMKKGVKLSQDTKDKMSEAQQKLAKSGTRKQTGGVCKKFIVNGLTCYGTYEKFYIEKLIKDDLELPIEADSIITPYGVYYPDFSFDKTLIEIKSDYTYEVLIGNKVSRFTKTIETNQYEKIKWVNKNIKPIKILVVDKRNNKIINKEIV